MAKSDQGTKICLKNGWFCETLTLRLQRDMYGTASGDQLG
jgi:hypothetical protein